MSRVTKQQARKDYPNFGITKGDYYFKWHVGWGRGSVRMSKSFPRPSQQTTAIYAEILAAGEAVEDIMNGSDTPEIDDLISALEFVESAADEVSGQYRDACQSSEGLGETWEEKADLCDEIAESARDMTSRLQSAQSDEELSDDDRVEEVRSIMEDLDCSFDA